MGDEITPIQNPVYLTAIIKNPDQQAPKNPACCATKRLSVFKFLYKGHKPYWLLVRLVLLICADENPNLLWICLSPTSLLVQKSLVLNPCVFNFLLWFVCLQGAGSYFTAIASSWLFSQIEVNSEVFSSFAFG